MATAPKKLKAAPPGGRSKTVVKAAPTAKTAKATAPAKKATVAKPPGTAKKKVAKPKVTAPKAKKDAPSSGWGRILVTGGNGFIGSELVRQLIQQGATVLAPVRPGSDQSRLKSLGATILEMDINQTDALEEHFSGLSFVFHVAGVIKSHHQDDYYQVNSRLTETLAKNAMEINPKLKRFVYISSIAATGPSVGQMLRSEKAPNHPVNDYGKSKLEGEARLASIDGLPYTVVRPPIVLGDGDDATLNLFKLVNNGFTFGVMGINRHYSFVEVRDLVRGILIAAKSPNALGEAFHFCHDNTLTLGEVQDEIATALDKKPIPLKFPEFVLNGLAALSEKLSEANLLHLPIDKSFVNNLVEYNWMMDSQKAHDLLGWTAEIGMVEAVHHSAAGFKEKGKLG